MKLITGWVAILLGVAGVVLCVLAAGGAWWAAFAVARQVDDLAASVDESVARIDDGFARVSGKVESAAASVEKVRSSASLLATGTTENDPALKARVGSLLDQLAPPLDRADAIADSLRLFATLLRRTAETAERFDRGGRRLGSAADKFESAAETLGVVQDRAEALRQGAAVPRAQELVRLAEQAKAPLDRLAGGLSDVRAAVGEVREELAEFRRKVRFWKFAGPALATLPLLWIGAGQLCLIGWGRRRLATPPPPAA